MNDVQFDPETGEVLEQPAPAPEKPKRLRKKKPRSNGRAPVPADESKRDKFLRLVTQRFDRIVNAIHVMRGLGRNQSSYEYSDADVDQVTDMLVAELQAMAAELKRRGRPEKPRLHLVQ